jgi:hypothetical protein
MKHQLLFILVIISLATIKCGDRVPKNTPIDPNINTGENTIGRNTSGDVEEERDEYLRRMNTRLEEMAVEIQEAR